MRGSSSSSGWPRTSGRPLQASPWGLWVSWRLAGSAQGETELFIDSASANNAVCRCYCCRQPVLANHQQHEIQQCAGAAAVILCMYAASRPTSLTLGTHLTPVDPTAGARAGQRARRTVRRTRLGLRCAPTAAARQSELELASLTCLPLACLWPCACLLPASQPAPFPTVC